MRYVCINALLWRTRLLDKVSYTGGMVQVNYTARLECVAFGLSDDVHAGQLLMPQNSFGCLMERVPVDDCASTIADIPTQLAYCQSWPGLGRRLRAGVFTASRCLNCVRPH
jgi:hypothetical protein